MNATGGLPVHQILIFCAMKYNFYVAWSSMSLKTYSNTLKSCKYSIILQTSELLRICGVPKFCVACRYGQQQQMGYGQQDFSGMQGQMGGQMGGNMGQGQQNFVR